MRISHFFRDGRKGIGLWKGVKLVGYMADDADYPGDLDVLIGGDLAVSLAPLADAPEIDLTEIRYAPPFSRPDKILCIGLNYADHTREVEMAQPNYPTVFARFASSLMGHQEPALLPACSEQFDFEGELALVIGKRGRHISASDAQAHIAGWSVFNDISVRDYQFKSPQWTVGKNFDATGAFGPQFVTADALPAGAAGLRIATRLNGELVQDANTDDMIFKPHRLIEILSQAMTLEPGDVIVTGTPSGVGMGRTPPLWMKPGDIVEVEVEHIGTLRNPVVAA